MSSNGHDMKILRKFDLCGAGPHHKKLPTIGSGGKGGEGNTNYAFKWVKSK